MGRTLINPPELHPTPGFSHISIPNSGQLIFFAGQVALDKEFQVLGGDSLFDQTVAAMHNLKTAMDSVGATWTDIVKRTIYCTQPTEFTLITQAIDLVTGSADHPPQALIGVSGLALPELLIEIEAIASIG